MWGNSTFVKVLIILDADVNAKNQLGWTPLFVAAHTSHEKVVQLLIIKGAKIDPKGVTPSGDTLLHATARGGIKNLVEQLIHKGADVNAKNKAGETPLFWAVDKSQGKVVQLLIAKGADVNTKDEKEETPLQLAIRIGHKETADLLRKHGAKK